ncbi:MAG: glycoside hydrolase family 25 protein [Lachnospiraceae bacterium]|nr:glycoside hydrolase family 25 protein [Lachnospiraceae bacterium]
MNNMNDEYLRKEGQKRKKKKNVVYIISIVFLSLITLSSLFVAYFSLKLYKDSLPEKQNPNNPEVNIEKTYTQEEVDALLAESIEDAQAEAIAQYRIDLKDTAEKTNGIASILRTLYPEYFVFYNKDHYDFIPVDDSLPKPNFDNEQIYANDGFLEYKKDGQTVSVKGIDVSKYQGNIDWEKVAASGVKYAMIRLGIRGYETGKLVTDENFDANVQGALNAGIEVGVYFVTQATNDAEAREEAQYVLDAIQGYNITYPIALDIEEVNKESSRTYNQTMDSRTQCAKTFMDYVKNAGYTPCVYGNLVTFARLVNINDLGDYEKWLALYDSKIYFPYEISIWQYSDKGTVDGIDGNVDVNITFPRN